MNPLSHPIAGQTPQAQACPAGALPAQTARDAARILDLSRSRQLVYVGGDGGVLAALLEAWPLLAGVWFGPADAQQAAHHFLDERGLGERIRYQAGEALAAIPAADLVVLSAVDEAVDQSLRLLVSAGPGWLPAAGRWIILQRASPHLSCVIGPPLMHAQGLRIASRWPLPANLQMLVCTPSNGFTEMLDERSNRPLTWSQTQ